jgi:hypothetical protein
MDIQNHSGFVEFELYSLAGVLIGKTIKKAQNNGVNTISLRTADFLLPEFKDGIYFIRMISGTSTLTGKLIIRR